MTKKIVLNLCLVCASILFCAVIVETSLRVVFPKYKSAADSKYDQDNVLIWSPRANRRSERPHPDTGRMHAVVYNDLALRQSRNFSRLAYGTNLAFFGDSFTANLGLPAQYMFTEPLDFLLNHSGGGPFNVLNFGVNGYGTSQEYLYYEQIDLKQQLHHVFYVLCTNDIRNIYESNLFSLDELGMLVNNPVPESSWWLKLLSRLHITYLAQDIRQRLMYSREDGWQDFGMRLQKIAWKSAHDERVHSNRADSLENSFRKGQINDDLDRAIVIFKRIISRWKKAVESNGGQFHVVLLPREREQLFLPLLVSDFSVIDLYKLFDDAVEGYDWSEIRFRNDGHWAEEGNRLAATQLYSSVSVLLGLPELGSSEVSQLLEKYYSSFPGGWLPVGQGGLAFATPAESSIIRKKYIALEPDPSEE